MTDENFEQMVLPHRLALYHFALTYTHQAEEAEDLVQETLLRALRGFSAFRAEGEIRAWLTAILRNQFLSAYRSRSRAGRPLSLETLTGTEAPLSPEPGPERRALSTLEHGALKQAVAALPPRYRSVLVLSDVAGLSYQEIGDRLNLPPGTVRSRLFVARDRVRRAHFAWRPDSQKRTPLFKSAPPA
jgi:RNA polymerase sigma-70 factor (ECF subfamily)